MSNRFSKGGKSPEMLPEYDFSTTGEERGKYYGAYRQGHEVRIHREDGSVSVRQVPPLATGEKPQSIATASFRKNVHSAKIAKKRETSMGLTYIEGDVKGAAAKPVRVRFLVDSGATYTLLPESVWKAIKLKPKRSMVFSLADGTTVERNVSECHLTLKHGDGHTPVILGQPGDEPLLGAVSLEILGLVLNPFNRTLQPMRMMLA